MAIIAILSAAFIPRFGNYITQAKKVSILNEAKSIVTAYESVKYKSTTKNENETIGSDLQGDNLPIEKDSLKKLGNATVAQCKLLLDTENHDFTLNDNTITISNTDSSMRPSSDTPAASCSTGTRRSPGCGGTCAMRQRSAPATASTWALPQNR